MKIGLPLLTVVLGGAASGKSGFAEDLVRSSGLNPVYIATAQAFDSEMRAKIDAHRVARGDGWRTEETPLNPEDVLRRAVPSEAVLLDCATLWLSNHVLAENDVSAATARLLEGLASCPAPVVVVSNEVGQGIVPDNAMARRFRDEQGRLNIALARAAQLVVVVTAGLPQVLKGTLP